MSKGIKDKVKISSSAVICGYNQYMGEVDFSDQMKVSYLVDSRNKFLFFFDFLHISAVNSKVIMIKWILQLVCQQ